MKKQLFIGSALLVAISAFPQSSLLKHGTAPLDLSKKMVNRGISPVENTPIISTTPAQQPSTVVNTKAASKTSSTTINWEPISGSMNIFGVLTAEQKPLHYNDELDAVSFIHRKSSTYISNPVASPSTAASGVIVGMVTTDWGVTWDSSAIWNNNLQHARYPQGGIYNPVGNTNLSSAYFVATGPITASGASTGWIGNFMASKKMDVKGGPGFNNMASATPSAQQFFSNASPLPTNGFNKVDFIRNDFASPDDGNVWALGSIMNINGTGLVGQNFRGARILKGTFTSGVFVWSGDSIQPPIHVGDATKAVPAAAQNAPYLFAARMAWSESGAIGYVYFLGTRAGSTGRNIGLQPMVYRTIDHGLNWHAIDGINFNDTAYYNKPVLNHIPGTSRDSLYKIPTFDDGGNAVGIDAVVDYNGDLHISGTILGNVASHPDTLLEQVHTFSLSSDNETGYSFGHTPGARPYVYDFVCHPASKTATTATATWSVHVIDSMWTEAPGTASTQKGFTENPWDLNEGAKSEISPRLQMSRTPNGKYIVYTWTESDTIFTDGAKKCNHLPDIKARLMDVANGYTVNPQEINVTNFDDVNPLVKTNAHKHYTSPKCKLVAEYLVNPSLGVSGADVLVPMTVSNSSPLSQLAPNTHYYSSARLTFTFTTVGVTENNFASVKNSILFPNPAKNNATLTIDLKNSSKVEVAVLNTIGQVVKSYKTEGQVGENNISVDLKGLSAGIYLVNVTSGNSTSTKKLIVE